MRKLKKTRNKRKRKKYTKKTLRGGTQGPPRKYIEDAAKHATVDISRHVYKECITPGFCCCGYRRDADIHKKQNRGSIKRARDRQQTLKQKMSKNCLYCSNRGNVLDEHDRFATYVGNNAELHPWKLSQATLDVYKNDSVKY